MAKLYFKYGAMGSSKTANALITKFNYEERGMKVWLIKPSIDVRDGADVVRSRIGLQSQAEIITPDKNLMEELKQNHKVVITLEDGEIDGGFGEKIARYFGASDMKVLNYGAHKEFSDRATLDELYTKYRLKKELILEDIKAILF